MVRRTCGALAAALALVSTAPSAHDDGRADGASVPPGESDRSPPTPEADRGRGRDHDHPHGHGGGPRGEHGHASDAIDVKIIGLNDYHGHLQSPGTFGQNTAVPAAQRQPVGGADALAAYVARLKRQNRRHNVVVGAGDFIGASPLISALFFDEPSVETLNRIGLEFNAVGNHEFDKGTAELLRLQRGGCKLTPQGVPDPNSCQGALVGTPVPFEGARFQ